jgi:hypothetical protein
VRSGRQFRLRETTMREPGATGFRPSRSAVFPAPTIRFARLSATVRSRFAHAQGRWLLNVALLIVGLGLGQGTIFAVQTALVAAGEYNLLAAFGLHYSFAILAVMLVDAGGSTTLARLVAGLSAERTTRDDVWRTFCETSAIRLLIALVIGALAAVYAIGFAADGFSRWYVMLSFPGLLLWTVNPVGLLDGLRLSGISGLTGAAAYVANAIGLALAVHSPPGVAGAILGGVFSIGYLLTLGAQWFVLGREGWFPRFRTMTYAGLAIALRDACTLSFQVVPGQINMRVLLMLSAAYLGAETTALFLYAKQLVTALTQIVALVLRVEFPMLVEKLAGAARPSIGDMLRAQKRPLYCAMVLAAAATGVAAIVASVPGLALHRCATIMLLLCPTILSISLSLMMIQAMAAIGAYSASAKALAIGSAVGLGVSYLLVSSLEVYALVLGELTFHLLGCYFGYRSLRCRNGPER